MKPSMRFFSTGKPWADFGNHIPAPLMRCTFEISGHRDVLLKICVPGYYQLYINGNKLTKGHLAPYTANPDHFLYYDTYDLSDILQEGENVAGLILGNGVLNSIGGIVWELHAVRRKIQTPIDVYDSVTMIYPISKSAISVQRKCRNL